MAAYCMPVSALETTHHGPHTVLDCTGIVQLLYYMPVTVLYPSIDPSPRCYGRALNTAELVIDEAHWVTVERRRSGLSLSLQSSKQGTWERHEQILAILA
jgi:hypothetical protein